MQTLTEQLVGALNDAAFDAHVYTCRQSKGGTNQEFAKCTYGPCMKWRDILARARAEPEEPCRHDRHRAKEDERTHARVEAQGGKGAHRDHAQQPAH